MVFICKPFRDTYGSLWDEWCINLMNKIKCKTLLFEEAPLKSKRYKKLNNYLDLISGKYCRTIHLQLSKIAAKVNCTILGKKHGSFKELIIYPFWNSFKESNPKCCLTLMNTYVYAAGNHCFIQLVLHGVVFNSLNTYGWFPSYYTWFITKERLSKYNSVALVEYETLIRCMHHF